MMAKRDLKADLELCNRATPGPWKEQGTSVQEWCIVSESTGDTVVGADYRDGPWVCITAEDADFVIEAREGWPHAIERAIKAEKQLEELLAWEKPKEKCYLSAMRRIAELESLVRELVDALDFMLGDKSTRTDWLVGMGKTHSKAKEVLGDERDQV